MAVRSGAGTGVVVSLVVFILTTFFLLVLTIVFYSGQAKALEAEAEAEKRLAVYVKPAQRNNPAFKTFEEAARSNNQSVTEHMHDRLQALSQLVQGTPTASLEQVEQGFATLGVAEGQSIRDAYRDAARTINDRQSEIDQLNAQLESWQQQNLELQAQIDALNAARNELDQQLEQDLGQYRDSVVGYRTELDEAVSTMQERVDRMAQAHEARVRELQAQSDQMNQDRLVLLQRIDELESKVRQDRIRAQDPALLVDGQVIDTFGKDEVFINRGQRQHIVRGMTFEVYSSASALSLVDEATGRLPRGKASLEVLKVAETTSTCKITRTTPGQPVVKGDVIANAVYDPTYKFRFLVHGKFDVDLNGVPTALEADYIRDQIRQWGGIVVEPEGAERPRIPGDLDFLVLGVEPPPPPPLRSDPTPQETRTYMMKRAEQSDYQELMRQAIDAQIPVLNANRFFILTGRTAR